MSCPLFCADTPIHREKRTEHTKNIFFMMCVVCYGAAMLRGRGIGTRPSPENQHVAYLFPHPVLSWEGFYQRSGNGQFRSFMY